MSYIGSFCPLSYYCPIFEVTNRVKLYTNSNLSCHIIRYRKKVCVISPYFLKCSEESRFESRPLRFFMRYIQLGCYFAIPHQLGDFILR